MQSSDELVPGTSPRTGSFESFPSEVSPELLISLATGPLLLTLLGSKALGWLMQEIGQQSEELFRGDLLPLLDFPSPKS